MWDVLHCSVCLNLLPLTDSITSLVQKMIEAEDPEKLRSLRHQLNQAIHERLEELRKQARDLDRKDRAESGKSD